MPLINSEITLDLNCSENSVICKADRTTAFVMTNAKTLCSSSNSSKSR